MRRCPLCGGRLGRRRHGTIATEGTARKIICTDCAVERQEFAEQVIESGVVTPVTVTVGRRDGRRVTHAFPHRPTPTAQSER